jgi:hypothetical protein
MDWEARYRNLNSILITIRDIVQDAEKFRKYRGSRIIDWQVSGEDQANSNKICVYSASLVAQERVTRAV